MQVLLVTQSLDHRGLDAIAAAIARRGAQPVRLDTDRFPTHLRIRHRQGPGSSPITLEDHGVRTVLDQVEAVYYRRLNPARLLPPDLDPQLRAPSVQESRLALLGLMGDLPCFHLDPWAAVRRCDNKALQLRLAQGLGLRVPATLTTNDPDAVREFAASCPGGVVTKMQASFGVHRADGKIDVVYTNAVSDEDLAALDGLDLCPMVFQERLPKAVELRVTVIGDQLFTIAVDSSATATGKVDWRRANNTEGTVWAPWSLDPVVADQVRALGVQLGLNYGGVDIIVTPAGEHVLLEWNPAGEFGWVMPHFGDALPEAFADLLTGRAPRRSPVAPSP
jgi:glutathione synthase/RimK-type ligase-like ATP-grasp enzyme